MSKAKGIRGEREVLHKFWNTGEWVALRVPASGSMPFPCPDIIAGNHSRRLAIECKVTSSASQYFSPDQIADLVTFSRLFGAEPWVSVKFLRKGTYFLSLDDLRKTPKHFVASLEICQQLGLSFDELIRKTN